MDNKMTNNNDEIEIDLKRLGTALLRKAWLIGGVAVLCAVCVLLYTFLFVTPEYQSSAMFYVNNGSSRGENSSSITSADISASRGLVKSYIAILNTRETMDTIAQHAGVEYTFNQLQTMIVAEAVDSTEILGVVVTCTDPLEAQKIADAVTYVLPQRIASIIEGTSAKVVAAASLPTEPSSPNYMRNALLGFLAGAILVAVLVLIRALLDVSIHTEDDIAQICSYPILTSVPDMTVHADAGRYAYSGKKKAAQNSMAKETEGLIGADISFPAAEAYKLLRTKLQFSFADESDCHIIGICSALSGEGKSLSAINLAYAAAQLGKRVLLIDCDMRRPTITKKLHISRNNGLSDFLSGQSQADNLIQACGLKGEELAFHVISSGRTPPNPVELLSSERMKNMLAILREKYEYIILDLPPVEEVSDALAVATQADGVIVVVRQNRCDRNALNNAIRQLEFVDAKILGIVLNCSNEEVSMYANGMKYAYAASRKKANGNAGKK